MQRIAVETHYLEPRDLAELDQLVRQWAQLVPLPALKDEVAYREILSNSTLAIGSPLPTWILESPLRMVQMPSAGYEEFRGVGFETRQDIALCNGRGVFSVGIAEHIIALMLAFCRRLPYFFEAQQQSRWARTWEGFTELGGQTLTIVGLGDVGGEIAKRAAGLGMRVLGVRRNANAPAPAGVSQVLPTEQLHEAIRQADQIVVAVPGGIKTRHLINAQAISAIKPGALLYSVGRGTAIDQTALIEALRAGRIAGAGLDVFETEPLGSDSPLWRMPQVIVTPHIAGYSPGFRARFGQLVIDNIQRYHAGKPLRNRIPLDELAGSTVAN